MKETVDRRKPLTEGNRCAETVRIASLSGQASRGPLPASCCWMLSGRLLPLRDRLGPAVGVRPRWLRHVGERETTRREEYDVVGMCIS